jgi:hypothetical protein
MADTTSVPDKHRVCGCTRHSQSTKNDGLRHEYQIMGQAYDSGSSDRREVI